MFEFVRWSCPDCSYSSNSSDDLLRHTTERHPNRKSDIKQEKPWQQDKLFQEFESILAMMLTVMKAKNKDYSGAGEAFANFNQIELLTKGNISREMGTFVRMTDKLSRVARLLQNSNEVLNEKIEDTLMDLANYSILMILMLKEKSESELSK